MIKFAEENAVNDVSLEPFSDTLIRDYTAVENHSAVWEVPAGRVGNSWRTDFTFIQNDHALPFRILLQKSEQEANKGCRVRFFILQVVNHSGFVINGSE